MRILDGPHIDKILDTSELMERIAAMFRAGTAAAPLRHHHAIADGMGTLLLMPAWNSRIIGVKITTVVPGNAARGLTSVYATYLLLDGATGQPLATLEGRTLTLRRTAATSALASRWLSRPDSARLLLMGAGDLAPHLARAHALVRPIREIAVWNRTPARAKALAKSLSSELTAKGVAVRATADLEGAVADADIISAATLATEPILKGAWLRPGQHLDLVGSFRPHMREADDETLRRASLYCDTRSGATKESGDFAGPIERGVIALADIRGDLFDLARIERPARTGAGEITLFKSVGHAFEDLATATLAFERG